MAYRSENLEKLKLLSDEIASRESKDTCDRDEVICRLGNICTLLEKPKINKQVIKDELQSLIAILKH